LTQLNEENEVQGGFDEEYKFDENEEVTFPGKKKVVSKSQCKSKTKKRKDYPGQYEVPQKTLENSDIPTLKNQKLNKMNETERPIEKIDLESDLNIEFASNVKSDGDYIWEFNN